MENRRAAADDFNVALFGQANNRCNDIPGEGRLVALQNKRESVTFDLHLWSCVKFSITDNELFFAPLISPGSLYDVGF